MTQNPLIAIVEDDPDVAKIIEQVLADFGFRTTWCRSAGDLLRRLRSLAPDLCIIDLGLPDMDGIEVMQRVRAQSPCGIMILTGRAHVSDRVMGLELGADDYVLKPFEPRELVARVRSILRRRETAISSDSRQIAEFAGWRYNTGMSINVEANMDSNTVQGLNDLGHDLEVINDSYQDFGAGQFIWRMGDPKVQGYLAASDPRRDGQAAGF